MIWRTFPISKTRGKVSNNIIGTIELTHIVRPYHQKICFTFHKTSVKIFSQTKVYNFCPKTFNIPSSLATQCFCVNGVSSFSRGNIGTCNGTQDHMNAEHYGTFTQFHLLWALPIINSTKSHPWKILRLNTDHRSLISLTALDPIEVCSTSYKDIVSNICYMCFCPRFITLCVLNCYEEGWN